MKRNRQILIVLALIVAALFVGVSFGKAARTEMTAPDAVPLFQQEQEAAAVDENGSYTTKEEVALYIHTYGHLPDNFITKKEAEALGWKSSEGNLWDVAPGKSIGGDRFGNYEGRLPEGDYRECDIGYEGGMRGPERLVYSADGRVYFTADHYKSFDQLYD